MDFSKHRLQKYLDEGQALEKGAQASITTSNNSSQNAREVQPVRQKSKQETK